MIDNSPVGMKYEIFFNEREHSYTDNKGNKYTSVTQVLSKYQKQFDAKYWSKAKAIEYIFTKNHSYSEWNTLKSKYGYDKLITLLEPKIKKNVLNKVIKAYLDKWDKENKEACDRGNVKHDFLEQSIDNAKGIVKNKSDITKLYTINDVIHNNDYNEIDLNKLSYNFDFIIYNRVKWLVENGYQLYTELAVYNYNYLIAGLIDLFAYRPKDKSFIILDWKTNKDDIHFQSGYYKKVNGIKTNEWVTTEDYLEYPLNNLYDCKGSIYSLQLSKYAYLAELFGLICKGLYLYHIRDNVQALEVKYLKNDIINMINHYEANYCRN
jgi:hypothetical protein